MLRSLKPIIPSMEGCSKGDITLRMSWMRERVRELSEQGVFFGTSSWKYPGWCGQLYTSAHYQWRGRFSQARFEKNCLREYAQTFSSVCVDAAYYTFPKESYLEGLVAQVPKHFQFALKVTDSITIKNYPKIARFGPLAGRQNKHFLDPKLFEEQFLQPCSPYRSQIGMLIFEFSKFSEGDYSRGRDFISDLSNFLSALPRGWPYGVELRNRTWLHNEYFECLHRHGVCPVFNSWEAMPQLSEQVAAFPDWTQIDHACARLLLKPGRRYETAVKAFSPYEEIRDEHLPGRESAAHLVRTTLSSGGRQKLYIFVNNRFEGNALGTILGILDILFPN